MNNQPTTADLITLETDAIRDMLLDKNRKYGDSAINPKRIFSRADAVEQIKVRIDDKLSRIESSQIDEDEDAELDLIGYLVLHRVAKRVTRNKRASVHRPAPLDTTTPAARLARAHLARIKIYEEEIEVFKAKILAFDYKLRAMVAETRASGLLHAHLDEANK